MIFHVIVFLVNYIQDSWDLQISFKPRLKVDLTSQKLEIMPIFYHCDLSSKDCIYSRPRLKQAFASLLHLNISSSHAQTHVQINQDQDLRCELAHHHEL